MPYPVLVTNVSPKTTEKKLADFFSFCGKILAFTMRTTGDTVEAIITFDTESAAQTSLMLTGATIDDQKITVAQYTQEDKEQHKEEEKSAPVLIADGEVVRSNPEITTPTYTQPDAPGSEDVLRISNMDTNKIEKREHHSAAADVIASIIASGYRLGANAINSAKQFDAERGISSSISSSFQSGSEVMKTKTNELDEQLKISETTTNLGTQISQGWSNIDEEYHVSETTTNTLAAAADTVNRLGNQISQSVQHTLENPSVQSTWNSFKSWGAQLGSSIQTLLEPVQREVDDIVSATSEQVQATRQDIEKNQPQARQTAPGAPSVPPRPNEDDGNSVEMQDLSDSVKDLVFEEEKESNAEAAEKKVEEPKAETKDAPEDSVDAN